jgi:putative transposase
VAGFIVSQGDGHGIPAAVSCRALGLSRSWYYKWSGRGLPPRAARRERLKAEVRRLFEQHGGKRGSPVITADLRDAGWVVSKNTVAALMREMGLAARPKRKRRGTTRPGRGRWRAPDLIGRDFAAAAINRKWYGDGTEIPTGEGKLYLDSVLDGCSRRIIGHALGEHHDAGLAYGALVMAVAARGGREQVTGVIFHTDRGSEYTAARVRKACRRAGIQQSMGRPGSALDNAVIEAWHSTLEFELRRARKFATKAEARAAVAAWIEEYNTTRRHSALGMLSPVAYERALAAKGEGGRVTAAGRCAAPGRKEAASPPLIPGKAAAPGLGDAPREGTGPPLSVKAGCDRRATANRQAARRMYTRSPALSAEPPAAPQGRESGQAPACPRPGRGASGDRRTPRTSRRQIDKNELAFDIQKKRKITRIHYP